ncbi:MAG: serine hydrolase [Synergistaceae bacterium]|nr:serine hydrolase [Synergistaceae bacterium]
MSSLRRSALILLIIIIITESITPSFAARSSITQISSLPLGDWQKTVNFPDWRGKVDDTLALNSMISFNFWHGQGKVYLKVSEKTKRFNMFINGTRINTSNVNQKGFFSVDISQYTLDGINTIQISNIEPYNTKDAITLFIPYPVILEGTLKDSGIRPETISLISDIIDSDTANGFTSAQLAVIRNGRLVYSNAWGKVNSYNQNGTRITKGRNADTNTLYDLASVSKMFGVNYAIQKLVTDEKLDIDSRIVDILGNEFANSSLTITYKNLGRINSNTMREWKSSITVRDVLCHRAGFPPAVHYHDKNYDLSALKHDDKASNPLYTGNDGSALTRTKTLDAICKTPLMYRPRTRIVYSDVDYMLLCFVIEKVTGQTLDVYMRENFWRLMNLNRIAYNPLKNRFSRDEIAATEINGNRRAGNINFSGIRTYTLQGEVHDEKAFHSMGGVSGHAGLFSNAEDIAKLASVMLTGGYGNHKFFSRNVIDTFTAPQNADSANWGVGWYREAEDERVWYFGTQTPSYAIGHQGWTGTLVIIDPSRNLVIAYLTNKINSPAMKGYTSSKGFTASWFTSATLGFVPQILSIGMDSDKNINAQLMSLLADMAGDSVKLITKKAGRTHPSVMNAKSKIDLLFRRAKASGMKEYLSEAERLNRMISK